MTYATYLGVEVLDVAPEREATAREHVARFGAVLDNPAGAFAVSWQTGSLAWTRTFRYVCTTRAELAALRDFLARRAGRYAPVWVPTWTDDLPLAPGVTTGGATLTIRSSVGAAALALLGTGPCRHCTVLPRAGGVYSALIRGAVDNGDGTATVTLDGVPGGPAITAQTGRVSLLKYARLDSDTITLDATVRAAVVALLPFRELPTETP